jgi:hypothetical protein
MNDKVIQPTELENLRNWLSTVRLGEVTPSLKVNGPQHLTAVLVVDVGQPLKQVRLTSEQVLEMSSKMKKAAKELLGSNYTLRVTADNTHGIHWVSVG